MLSKAGLSPLHCVFLRLRSIKSVDERKLFLDGVMRTANILFDHGAEIGATFTDGRTILHQISNEETVVNWAVKHGISPDVLDINHITPPY